MQEERRGPSVREEESPSVREEESPNVRGEESPSVREEESPSLRGSFNNFHPVRILASNFSICVTERQFPRSNL